MVNKNTYLKKMSNRLDSFEHDLDKLQNELYRTAETVEPRLQDELARLYSRKLDLRNKLQIFTASDNTEAREIKKTIDHDWSEIRHEVHQFDAIIHHNHLF